MQNISNSDLICLIDKIINIVPEIKNKRDHIINELVSPKSLTKDEYMLEKININGSCYYRDKYKSILDNEGNLVGIWVWDYNKNQFNYYIFADEKTKIIKNHNIQL